MLDFLKNIKRELKYKHKQKNTWKTVSSFFSSRFFCSARYAVKKCAWLAFFFLRTPYAKSFHRTGDEKACPVHIWFFYPCTCHGACCSRTANSFSLPFLRNQDAALLRLPEKLKYFFASAALVPKRCVPNVLRNFICKNESKSTVIN